jgi:hypothetical protein
VVSEVDESPFHLRSMMIVTRESWNVIARLVQAAHCMDEAIDEAADETKRSDNICQKAT